MTRLGQDPPIGFKNDPVLGLVENLGLHGAMLSAAKIYVGVLAATILFIATNAGVIGASRITYSMSSHRQLPEVFRRLHPKFKTPWLSLLVFAGVFSILFMLPGQRRLHRPDVRVRRDALVHDRPRRGDPAPAQAAAGRGVPTASGRSCKIRGVSWPLFAILGGLGTGLAWLVVVVQDAPTRYAGLAWLAAGFVFYVLYRRRLGLPLRETVLAPLQFGPAIALEYRTILVPIVSGPESHEAIDLAARLAAERGATIVALRVIVVPLDSPLDAPMPARGGSKADRLLDEARLAAVGLRRPDDRPRRPRPPRRAGRSSRRRPAARRRSSSSARRAAATGRSSGRPSTTSSRTRPAA